MPLPDGVVPSGDPWECNGGCARNINPGRPYWGGRPDYFGEALDVHCERCAVSWFVASERQVDDYERKLGVKK
jgi:hypothetical protein